MAAQPQKRFLGKFLGASSIARLAQKIPENGQSEFLEVRGDLFVEGHRQRALLVSRRGQPVGKGAASEVARLKYHLFYYITDAGRILRVAGKFDAFLTVGRGDGLKLQKRSCLQAVRLNVDEGLG